MYRCTGFGDQWFRVKGLGFKATCLGFGDIWVPWSEIQEYMFKYIRRDTHIYRILPLSMNGFPSEFGQ